jgi:hypothetical protein
LGSTLDEPVLAEVSIRSVLGEDMPAGNQDGVTDGLVALV